MADENDEQTTAVHQTQPAKDATAVHQTQPEAEAGTGAAEEEGGEARTEVFFSRDEAERAGEAPTPPPPQAEERTGGSSPAEADRNAADEHDAFAENPHLFAIGAFAGAFVVAKVLKALTGGDDD